MWLRKRKNQVKHQADITKVKKDDYQAIEKSDQFSFNWRVEQVHDVYKIYLVDERDQILGLMSLEDVKAESRIHIHLIEVSLHNQGKNKEYDRIAGCLLGYACQLSFDLSYEGFVSLKPKTVLIDHYQENYGFHKVGTMLAIGSDSAKELVQTYC